MNDRKDTKKIQNALDTTFSNLKDDPWLAQKVLANAKGEVKVKKKLSVGLVLTLVLLLAAMTGLALNLYHEFFEQVAQMQVVSGYYDDWSLEEKLCMLSLMEQYGVLNVADETAVRTARDTTLPAEAREEALDAFMAERYGIYGRTDVIGLESILASEKGDVLFWPVEEKAWYTDLLSRLGLLSSEEERRYYSPTFGELSQTEAETLARAYAKTLTETQWEALADTVPAVNFALVRYYNETANTWEVTLYDPETDTELFITFPSAKGTTVAQATFGPHYLYDSSTLTPWREQYQGLTKEDLKSDQQKTYERLLAQYGSADTWSLAVQHEYMPEIYLLPTATELTAESAQERGLAALTAAYPALDIAELRVHLTLTETLNARAYGVYLREEKGMIVVYCYLDAATGETLKLESMIADGGKT